MINPPPVLPEEPTAVTPHGGFCGGKSQQWLRYPTRVHGGDRLPWIEFDGTAERRTDNFMPLTSLDWQVHVYGAPPPGIPELCQRRELPLHVFPWQHVIRRTGLRRNAVYLVRPDGYVALADPDDSAARLEAYLDARGLRPGAGARQGGKRDDQALRGLSALRR